MRYVIVSLSLLMLLRPYFYLQLDYGVNAKIVEFERIIVIQTSLWPVLFILKIRYSAIFLSKLYRVITFQIPYDVSLGNASLPIKLMISYFAPFMT